MEKNANGDDDVVVGGGDGDGAGDGGPTDFSDFQQHKYRQMFAA